ncbi:uncharacterized protein LOC121967299 isoform X3 [Zingiber officinale]|uniref:uncharacterized protein LOC121967299 isoform X3 n=1 Tax=Zingiber officinale TaxID=94328 RepID=UPI001C4CBC58|nr:uncharacterized protein LOC121967299 isoform X3 [Zingiber officinale]
MKAPIPSSLLLFVAEISLPHAFSPEPHSHLLHSCPSLHLFSTASTTKPQSGHCSYIPSRGYSPENQLFTRIAPIKAASRSKLPIPPSPDVATLSTDHPSATYLEPHHQCRTPLQRLSRNRELAFIEAEDFVSGLASRCRISGHDRQIKLAGKIFMESPGDPVRQFHVTFEDNLTILDFDRDECRDEIGVGFSLHLEVVDR